ncbi:hypothetical protein [Laspinema olomoucense]|uniref:hypothetical protein n=1 Tax=Laspinema olomoucense TaxID=3231600 RepID=UPI0021BB0D0E|nr:hypothetical protein [Laspinema sp. D3d]MCT7975084.1 hypothetical protein [Laspinema sp. D3d]
MTNVLELLTDLALDPKQQLAFEQDPEAAIAHLNLSVTERETLLTGDRQQIESLFAGDRIPLAVIATDPAPDPLPDPDPPPFPDTPADSEPSET